MAVRDISVLRYAIYNASFLPNDAIVDFESSEYKEVFYALIPTQTAQIEFWHGNGINRNDSYWAPTADISIDEDYGGNRFDFAHSLGTWGRIKLKEIDNSTWLSGDIYVQGSWQDGPTHLNAGQLTDGGNPRVFDPESRHYTVNKPGNIIEGAQGILYPYKVRVPKISSITPKQKWKDLRVSLYAELKSVFNGGNWYLGNAHKTFNLYQKAISITKDIANNNYINNNQQITRPISQTFYLNKTESRGATINSYWLIEKKDINNNWVNAVETVDYTLLQGALNLDILEFQFQVQGEYKITNYSKGNNSISTGLNEDYNSFFVIANPDNKTIIINDYITLPDLVTKLTPDLNYKNVTTELEPTLTGIEMYKVNVDCDLDLINASYIKEIKTINHDNNDSTDTVQQNLTNSYNIEQWKQLILDKSIVKCIVKNKITNVIIEERDCNSLNTFLNTFLLPKNEYEIGYLITPKNN